MAFKQKAEALIKTIGKKVIYCIYKRCNYDGAAVCCGCTIVGNNLDSNGK